MIDLGRLLQPPPLTPTRSRLAFGIALATDILQIALGPVGWAFADEILDAIAGVVLWRLLGFHPLLLPTFVLELVPVADLLPTWTGCVGLVVALRRRQRVHEPPLDSSDVIDV